MTRAASFLLVALGVLAIGTPELPRGVTPARDRTEVVVALASPPLAHARRGADRIAAEQRAFRSELARSLPDARVHWRYRLVANGFAVDLPRAQVPRLRELAGVREVFAAAAYAPLLEASPAHIGAPALWGPTLDTAGQGIKIGIIDTGVDASHPFFDPAGYTMPAGFPKGQRRFTSAKVIVARAFAPPRARSREARLAFDGQQSSHGTHVAGIAAGNARTNAGGGRVVSGVAPRAYIGNYKALVRAESGLSPIENAAELVAAIEAAVRDGMDVINLSLGEPEIEPSRNIVALALDAAAAAGVVPVAAAGNDNNETGAGSVGSPASAAGAIAVGAVEVDGSPARASHADFSSVGPTAISVRLKPDVAAPGVGILSATPDGGWTQSSGTSMASPHVAGAAALLAQRHPAWTVAQIKSALVQTGIDVAGEEGIAGPQVQGGGLVALGAADRPLLHAAPSSLSFGLVERAGTRRGSVRLDDAGGGAGPWQVVERRRTGSEAARLTLPASVTIPGALSYELATSETAAEGDVTGYIEIRRGTDLRRIPYWGRVVAPALGRHRTLRLGRPGLYRGSTAGRPALVTRYRYPESPVGLGVTTTLRGPEAVYRVRLTRPVANFGVVVTRSRAGVRVEPRVVSALDENRLAGYAGLPVAHNPYLEGAFQVPIPAAAALRPRPGEYAVVFDSATRAGAGRFTFRFWVHDVTPPTLRLRTRVVRRGAPAVLVTATDSGSGVFPGSIEATIDGDAVRAAYANGVVRLRVDDLAVGRHRLRLSVSDYQETKNTENVPGVLPNTRTLTATITVRRR